MYSKESLENPSSTETSQSKTSTVTTTNLRFWLELVSLLHEQMTLHLEEERTPPSVPPPPPSDRITTPYLASKPQESHGYGAAHGFSAPPGRTAELRALSTADLQQWGLEPLPAQAPTPRRRHFSGASPTGRTSTAASNGAYRKTTGSGSRSRRSRSR